MKIPSHLKIGPFTLAEIVDFIELCSASECQRLVASAEAAGRKIVFRDDVETLSRNSVGLDSVVSISPYPGPERLQREMTRFDELAVAYVSRIREHSVFMHLKKDQHFRDACAGFRRQKAPPFEHPFAEIHFLHVVATFLRNYHLLSSTGMQIRFPKKSDLERVAGQAKLLLSLMDASHVNLEDSLASMTLREALQKLIGEIKQKLEFKLKAPRNDNSTFHRQFVAHFVKHFYQVFGVTSPDITGHIALYMGYDPVKSSLVGQIKKATKPIASAEFPLYRYRDLENAQILPFSRVLVLPHK